MMSFFLPKTICQIIRLPSVFVLFTFLVACRSVAPAVPDFVEVEGIGGYSSCFFRNSNSNAIVIRSLPDLEPYRECTTSPNDFNFVSQSLVVVLFQGSGCEIPTFEITDIKNNDQNQKIFITVEVNQIGDCASLHTAVKWIAVDPVPENYEVLVEYVRK